jgi:proteasome lid subunit RPN8/RPN11
VNTSARFLLRIPRNLFDEMLAHARAEQPNECCGLLAGPPIAGGATAEVTERYALINELHSPTEFQSEPRSMVHAMRDMRRLGNDMLAIYHSHPTSEPVPSKKDLERNWIPGVMHLIVGVRDGVPEVRAWWLLEEGYLPAEFEVVSGIADS